MDPTMERYSEARAHLQEILRRLTSSKATEDKPTREQGEIEYKLGLCAEGERKYEEAVNWYRLALAHAPSLIDTHVHLAALLRNQLKKPDEADLVMDAREVKSGLIKANPQSARAYLERARYRQRYRIEGADKDIAQALELAPDDLDVLIAAAEQALGQGDFPAARAYLAGALKAHASDQRLYQALAGVEIAAGQLEDAEAKLKQGIEAVTSAEDRTKLALDPGQRPARPECRRCRRKRRFARCARSRRGRNCSAIWRPA